MLLHSDLPRDLPPPRVDAGLPTRTIFGASNPSDTAVPGIPCVELPRPADLTTVVQLQRDGIRQLLSEHGAVLLRGFRSTPRDLDEVLQSLGVQLDNDYVGGATPRKSVGGRRFTSTETPKPFIVPSHTEMCYLPRRPGTVAFYCERAPRVAGETPIFDCAHMYRRLTPTVRDRLLEQGVMYRRLMPANPHWLRVLKPWSEVFRTSDASVVEAECERLRLTYAWRPDGSLQTEICLPGVVHHPRTDAACVNLTVSNVHALADNMRRFRERYPAMLRFGIQALSRFQYSKEDVFFETRWGDGSRMSLEDTRALGDAAWESAVVFPWRAGDLLVLDNIRWGHGRLNVRGERRVLALLGDTYDVEVASSNGSA